MAIIGWARVSTKEQELDLQLKALKAAGCEKIFEGKRSGASSENQDELNKMVEYVRDGDVVIVTKLDRLGRSLKQVLLTLEALKGKGATFRSLDGAVDTTNQSPFAQCQLQMIAAFAELERNLIVTRTTEGREDAQARGVKFGRNVSYTEAQSKDVIQRQQAGETIYSISKKTGMTRAMIYRILEKAGVKTSQAE